MVKPIIKDIKELRKQSVPVDKDEDLSDVVQDLKDTLATVEGYGLTANQIGVYKRLAYIKVGDEEAVLLNPKILQREDKIKVKEGCLSIPGVDFYTDRYNKITFISNGEEYNAEGLLAQIVQHEVDHMNGITILQRKHKAR